VLFAVSASAQDFYWNSASTRSLAGFSLWGLVLARTNPTGECPRLLFLLPDCPNTANGRSVSQTRTYSGLTWGPGTGSRFPVNWLGTL